MCLSATKWCFQHQEGHVQKTLQNVHCMPYNAMHRVQWNDSLSTEGKQKIYLHLQAACSSTCRRTQKLVTHSKMSDNKIRRDWEFECNKILCVPCDMPCLYCSPELWKTSCGITWGGQNMQRVKARNLEGPGVVEQAKQCSQKPKLSKTCSTKSHGGHSHAQQHFDSPQLVINSPYHKRQRNFPLTLLVSFKAPNPHYQDCSSTHVAESHSPISITWINNPKKGQMTKKQIHERDYNRPCFSWET